MSNGLLTYLKNTNLQLPISWGEQLAKIPFEKRPGIGSVYRNQKKNINAWPGWSERQQQEFIYSRFMKVFKHAFMNIPFYRDLYRSAGMSWQDIRCFEDISRIPVINKSMLQNVPLQERSYPVKNRIHVNTGGSSGSTLAFYTDPLRFGNEWAHLHHIWKKLDYKPTRLKLIFDGRSSVRRPVQYDFVRHSLRHNIYNDPAENAEELLKISAKHSVSYLHGYPSAIYHFALFCRDHQAELLGILRKTLKGAFLSSEFPLPLYRNTIEDVFGIPTQSFYGHTETCVMACEENRQFEYNALQTYGFAEAQQNENGTNDLIGTGYFNFASPFIRYNTEDEIEAVQYKNGMLYSFEIKGGRKGEFITDRDGNRIAVTGLIFGRHHRLFDRCKYIQVKQSAPGKAVILYVLNEGTVLPDEPGKWFDTGNIAMEFEFEQREQPVLTKAGKLKLLVNETT